LGRVDTFLKKWAQRRISSDEERSLVIEFLKQSLLRPQSSERAILHIADHRNFAKEPLIDEIPQLEMPYRIIFGEHDWMYRQYLNGEQIENADLITVEKAGHRLHFDNPAKTNHYILSFIDDVHDDQLNKF